MLKRRPNVPHDSSLSRSRKLLSDPMVLSKRDLENKDVLLARLRRLRERLVHLRTPFAQQLLQQSTLMARLLEL